MQTTATAPMHVFECPLGRHRPWRAFPEGDYAATCMMCEQFPAPRREPGPGPAEFQTWRAQHPQQDQTTTPEETTTMTTAPKTIDVTPIKKTTAKAAPAKARPRSVAASKAARNAETQAASTTKLDAITEAEDAVTRIMENATDPYRRAAAMKKETGNKRGPGRKVSQEWLVGYLGAAIKTHPEYRFGQHVEVAYWTEGLAINRARMAAAWAEVTGEAPAVRAPRAVDDGPAVPATRMGAAKVADIAARKMAHRQKAAAKATA
jgi:hypothetical protein